MKQFRLKKWHPLWFYLFDILEKAKIQEPHTELFGLFEMSVNWLWLLLLETKHALKYK